ncbi:GNAT family N-acetyltransferase [Larkinella harenae]
MITRLRIDCENGITLAPPVLDDARSIVQLANNYAIWRNLRDGMPHPYTLNNAIQFIESVSQGAHGLVFGIYVDEQIAGISGIVPQTDIHRLSGEIGYWLGEPYWGRGIATIAIRHLIRYAFANTELIRLFAGVMPHNKASMRVLEKNGFGLDIIQRAAVYKEGKVLDEYRYSLIDEQKVTDLPA